MTNAHSIPVLDTRTSSAREVRDALFEFGAILVRDTDVDGARCDHALADAKEFFALPASVKHAIAIENSQHFRGYSEMRNERDWREQIHFGRELSPGHAAQSYSALQGPNLWPPDRAWRERMIDYLAAVEGVGQRVLASVAESLELHRTTFADGPARDPYLLMKLIRYHAQQSSAALRSGVAPHLDFSWITLTLQDDVGGLQVRTPAGAWLDVPPTRGAWLVNVGEILQFATRNVFSATPHRVVNPSASASRVSIPVFLNPNLDAIVEPLPVSVRSPVARPRTDTTHVHRVLDPARDPVPFRFGDAEWRRKGQNVWCEECVEGSPVERGRA